KTSTSAATDSDHSTLETAGEIPASRQRMIANASCMAWLPRTRAAASTTRANAGCRRRTSQSRSIAFLFLVGEFVPRARSGANRADSAAARRLAAVKQRSEGNPHAPAIWPAMSTPAMKAAEPVPRTQPYSKAPGVLRIVERDHESAKASDSGTSGASMAAQIKLTKASIQNECAGK